GVVIGLWRALRRTGGALAALVAALCSVGPGMAGASTWGANFVFPYTYAATLGMMFLVIALAAFLYEHAGLAIAALVAASWCKVEYAAGAALIVIVLLIAPRLRSQYALAFLGAMAATFVIVALHFWHTRYVREN